MRICKEILVKKYSVIRKNSKRKKKKSKFKKMSKIVNALENFEESSAKECMKILKKVTTYEDPLYYVAISAFCKKKEYRFVWVEMESNQE